MPNTFSPTNAQRPVGNWAALTAKYHDALVRVAGQCTVKRTMEGPPEMTVETIVRSEK